MRKPIKRMTDRGLYFNATELKKRGWTETAIKTFLGKEDTRGEHPFYKSAPGVRYYFRSRVLAIEETPEFKAWNETSDIRKEAAKLISR